MNGEIADAEVFVKIEGYQNLASTLNLIRSKLKDISSNMDKLNAIKNKEDSEINSWNDSLGKIGQKVDEISRALSEHRQS